MTLCGTVLSEHATSTAFGNAKPVTHKLDAVSSARRA
jgi:hypothetical protein